MKKLLLLLFVSLNLFANTITLDAPLEGKIFLGLQSKVFIDKNRSYTLENIEEIKDKFEDATTHTFGYRDDVVWIHFRLINSSKVTQNLIFKNNNYHTRYVDILTIKNDKKKIHKLGANRAIKSKEIPHRYQVFSAILHPGESIEVYSAHYGIGNIETNWSVLDYKSYALEDTRINLFYGIYLGFVLSLIVYAMGLLKSFKSIGLLSYMFFGAFNILSAFSVHGILYALDLGLNEIFVLAIGATSLYIPIIALSIFTIRFFELKKNIPKIYKILQVGSVISFFMFLANYPRFDGLNPLVHSQIQASYIALYYFGFLIVGLFIYKKRLPGGGYFLAGLGVLSLNYAFAVLQATGLVYIKFDIAYIVLIVICADMFFISLAIAEKIHLLKEEQENSRRLLLEHAKFENMGKVISEVVHQIKTPLVQVGSIASNIAMIFDTSKQKFSAKEHATIQQLESSIEFIAQTIDKIYESYKTSQKKEEFKIHTVVLQTLELFTSKMKENNVHVNYNQKSLVVYNDAFALKHILLVLIENAIDIAKERNIKNAQISISERESKDSVILCVEDNCGGIDEKLIDFVFDIYVSNKKDKGFGIGLALAKHLAVDVCKGDISVQNTQNGAKFYIKIPTS